MDLCQLWALLYLLLVSCQSALALAPDQAINIGLNYWPEPPRQIVFFKDSKNCLLSTSQPFGIYLSTDHGNKWDKVPQVSETLSKDRVSYIVLHPFDNKIAYILGSQTRHFVTTDAGISWQLFESTVPPVPTKSTPLYFHASNQKLVIFMGVLSNPVPTETAYYTTNGFVSMDLLLERAQKCKFAHSNPHFQLAENNLIFCSEIKPSVKFPLSPSDFQLVRSNDFFKANKAVIDFNGMVSSSVGLVGYSVVEKYITAATLPPERGADLDLYISLDGYTWALAKFPMSSSLKENAYTVLESQPYSLTVDVLTGTSNGVIYTSNSNGTYFLKSLSNTRRSIYGITDFERVEWQSGIMLANQYASGSEDVITKLSWDEGGHWNDLNPPEKDVNGRPWPCTSDKSDPCKLHLHSITSDLGILGKLFSEKSSPGILIGIGNVGPHLIDKHQCSVFVSVDGGVTWRHVLEGPYHYRQLDSGSVIVASEMDKLADELSFSKNMGASWTQIKLPHKIAVQALMTDPDSLSSSLLVLGVVRDRGERYNQFISMQIDFNAVFSRRCGDSDYEQWQLHVKGECVMGRKSTYRRAKIDQNCSVGATVAPTVQEVTCPCEDDDFECDLNFEPDASNTSQCVLAKGAVDPLLPKNCRDTYMGSSGWRKIPGNKCVGGVTKDAPVKRKCGASGKVEINAHVLPGDIERAYTLEPLTIIVQTWGGSVFRSVDGGVTWKDGPVKVTQLIQHEHVPERLFVVLSSGEIHYSASGGESFDKLTLPAPPNSLGMLVFDFHPDKPDWLLFTGVLDCPDKPNCRTAVYVSQNAGKSWGPQLDEYIAKCLFSRDVEFKKVREDMVYCASYAQKKGSMRSNDYLIGNARELVTFTGFSASSRTKVLNDVLDYFVDHGFLLAAEVSADMLSVKITSDGTKFTEVQFPPDLVLDKRGLTVLSSSPKRVFMDMVQTGIIGREMGTIFTSDSAGLDFSISLSDTNRGGIIGAVVDFTRPLGTSSVAIANRVINAEAVRSGRATNKLIQSYITYNDGGLWQRLPSTECEDACFVQLLNAATLDFTPIASVKSAGGIFLGIGVSGNDETYLQPVERSHTFLTIDGGHNWKKVADGPYRSAILDHGGIIIMVPAYTPTSTIKWTWDYGETWREQTLSVKFKKVGGIIPNVDGKQAVAYIYGTDDSDKIQIVSLNFGHMGPDCTMDDIETWTLTGPSGEMCSLGERLHHPRRKKTVQCIVGSLKMEVTKDICDCDIGDFECNIGFWRNESNQCVLKGPDPDKPKNCPDGTEYESRGAYRKISASKCKGGIEMPSKVKRICGRENEPSPSVVFNKQITLPSPIMYHLYTGDKTIVSLDNNGRVQFSANEGRSWELVQNDGIAVFAHPLKTAVYVAKLNELRRSDDGGKTFLKRTVFPAQILSDVLALSLHPEEPDWLLFNGRACLPGDGPCSTSTFFTKDAGDNWHLLLSNVHWCSWARSDQFKLVSRSGVYCILGDSVVYSDDLFINDKTTVMSNVGDVAMEGEYFLGMANGPAKSGLSVTRDFQTTAFGEFPQNADSLHEGYTTLPGHQGSLLVNVALSRVPGRELGRLFKSDSNGTHFSLMHDNTHQNSRGFVDYEPIQGIPGLAILNVVSNAAEVLRKGVDKKLQTAMTYNDGATWVFLKPPEFDSRGQEIKCKDRKDPNSCSLHLHSYTERRDPQNVFDSVSAPGLFLAVGNVGESLSEYKDGNVFLTQDAGRTWREVMKGAYQYEFGDHGAIIVLINDEEPVSELKYSINNGKTFQTLRIVAQPGGEDVNASSEVRFKSITTRPDGTGQNFLLVGTRISDSTEVMHFIDFSSLQSRTCNFDLNNPDRSDFEPWSLDNKKCYFGKKIVYYRRKEGRDCAILNRRNTTMIDEKRCECSRDDFECAFGFAIDAKGECAPLPSSKSPPCGSTVASGYVRHPMSECVNGIDLSKPKIYYCGGGISVGGWFALILVPLASAGLGFLAMKYKREGGELQDLIPSRVPSLSEITEWITEAFGRLTHRIRYSRLGPQIHVSESSTSLLEEN